MMERRLGSAEGSLEKFSQMTHFPRTESLNGKIDVGVLPLAVGLTVISGIWERVSSFPVVVPLPPFPNHLLLEMEDCVLTVSSLLLDSFQCNSLGILTPAFLFLGARSSGSRQFRLGEFRFCCLGLGDRAQEEFRII